MSENTNLNNPNANGGNNQGNGEQQKDGKRPFFLVRWIKRGVEAGKEFVDTVKEHPVTAGVLTALGIAAGGAGTYAVMNAARPKMPEQVCMPQPQIEGEFKEDEEQTEESPNADYVDVPGE